MLPTIHSLKFENYFKGIKWICWRLNLFKKEDGLPTEQQTSNMCSKLDDKDYRLLNFNNELTFVSNILFSVCKYNVYALYW